MSLRKFKRHFQSDITGIMKDLAPAPKKQHVSFQHPNPHISTLYNNPMIANQQCGNWGKTMSYFNEHMNVHMFRSVGFESFQNDEEECPIVAKNNSTGWDIVIKHQDIWKRIQCKTRERSSKTPFTKQVAIVTTRRANGSNKAVNKGSTKHIPYRAGETDFFLISIINSKYEGKERRSKPETWGYSLVPEKVLYDTKNNGWLVGNITKDILQRYALPTEDAEVFKCRINEILCQ